MLAVRGRAGRAIRVRLFEVMAKKMTQNSDFRRLITIIEIWMTSRNAFGLR